MDSMTDNEKIARWIGWKWDEKIQFYVCEREAPNGPRVCSEWPFYNSDYNLFIEAWNKAVSEFTPELKRRIKERGIPSMITVDEDKVFRALNLLPYEFILEKRLPILINIIEFLEKEK